MISKFCPFLVAILITSWTNITAQKIGEVSTIKAIDLLNREIDQAVLNKDTAALNKMYADDFIFTHGGGDVESKEQWIKSTVTPGRNYQYRNHDSTYVELHKDVAIVKGRLLIARSDKDKLYQYGIRYVRTYALRKKHWELISHLTVKEWKF